MSTFLVIDSSTNVCTVALCTDNHYQELVSKEAKSHGASMLALVEELLRSNSVAMDSIDAFSVVAGPGSFTGLRIGK